jgi:Na+:H+ antiporter, NhaA family
VAVSGETLGDAATSRVTLGVVVGLVVGKVVGVAGAIAVAQRLGVGRLPTSVTTRHILGMAGLAGIGFTVSIFITGLAFSDLGLTDQAKIGVLAASVLAAAVGTGILTIGGTTARHGDGDGDGDQSSLRQSDLPAT